MAKREDTVRIMGNKRNKKITEHRGKDGKKGQGLMVGKGEGLRVGKGGEG